MKPDSPPSSASPSPSAGSVRRAVIDVGTNSVKLLVAEVSANRVEPLVERSEQTRLGRGFYETRRLQPAAITRTARAVAEFAAQARELGTASTRIIATSATRDAANPGELIAAIQEASGLPVEIISGEQEADWVFRGVISDPIFAGQPLLIVDVGGGSTEFILGEGDRQQFRHSFPFGTVRMLEQLPHSDPPTAAEWGRCRALVSDFLEHQVCPVIVSELRTFSARAVQLVGTGGTTSILARIELGLTEFQRDRIEAVRLTREKVQRQRERLWSLPLADRKKIVGLPADRADVILTGVPIYEALMERLGFSDLRISTRGLRFAAVMTDRPHR
ncbi:MAG: phosphatase [Verrucomicrobia bacterium]|nr:MAG: phosphatase [Verrucomicrobiota bacterium]